MRRALVGIASLALATCIDLDADFPKVAGHGGDTTASGDSPAGDPGGAGDAAAGDPGTGDAVAAGDPGVGDAGAGGDAECGQGYWGPSCEECNCPIDTTCDDGIDGLGSCCGDGNVEGNEQCEDGNNLACGSCDDACQFGGRQAQGTIAIGALPIEGSWVTVFDLVGASATFEVEEVAAIATATSGTPVATNEIDWTAIPAGTDGNDIGVQIAIPPESDSPLLVTVTGPMSIRVDLETDSGSTAISTAAQVAAAVNALETNDLVTANASGGGTGVPTAESVTLSGGADGDGVTGGNVPVKVVYRLDTTVRDALARAFNDVPGLLILATPSAGEPLVDLRSEIVGDSTEIEQMTSYGGFTPGQLTGGTGSACQTGIGCLTSQDCLSGSCSGTCD